MNNTFRRVSHSLGNGRYSFLYKGMVYRGLPPAKYQAVLREIDFAMLMNHAYFIRTGQPPEEDQSLVEARARGVPRTRPLVRLGQRHVRFTIEFQQESEWVQWHYKFPASWSPGTWTEYDAMRFDLEVKVMRYMNRQGVPVADIIAYKDRANSEVDSLPVPFILETHINGESLADNWHFMFDSDKRQALFLSICNMMKMAGRFRSSLGGIPRPPFDNSYDAVSPVKIVEIDMEPYPNLRTESMAGPFMTYKAFFGEILYSWPPILTEQQACDAAFLRFLISRLPEPAPNDPGKFVLTHPKLTPENILVDEDSGEVVGFTGWTDNYLVPRLIGNQSYPAFLVSVPQEGSSTPVPDAEGGRERRQWKEEYQELFEFLTKANRTRPVPAALLLICADIWEAIQEPGKAHRILVQLFAWLIDSRSEGEVLENIYSGAIRANPFKTMEERYIRLLTPSLDRAIDGWPGESRMRG